VLDEVLGLYFEESIAEMRELTGAVDRADTVAVGKAAHKLKGSSSGLGASHVAQIASELEATAELRDLSAADALLASLQRAIGDTREAFANRVR
jgi:HPt (histidine-containing phosphotransfer) domain-containing protein